MLAVALDTSSACPVASTMPSPTSVLSSGTDRVTAISRWAILSAALSAVSVAALILTEIWLSIAALEWSIVNLFDLGVVGYALLSMALVPTAGWASWRIMAFAWDAEYRLAVTGEDRG